MYAQLGLEKCQPFIRAELKSVTRPERLSRNSPSRLAVTISRQSGSGARIIGEQLAHHLQAHAPTGSRPWTVFDRNLVEKVLEDHNLPSRFARYMPEDRIL